MTSAPSQSRTKHWPLILLITVAAGTTFMMLRQRSCSSEDHTQVRPAPRTDLSVLAKAPDWSGLDAYQETMTEAMFVGLLDTIFTTSDQWRELIELTPDGAKIQTASDKPYYLRFALRGHEAPSPRSWRSANEHPPAPAGFPLEGVHLAIDPGHLGGDWAKMEERWFAMEGQEPVIEGEMTLYVARLLKTRLEELGAEVSLVRNSLEPVTDRRPEELMETIRETALEPESPEGLRRLAERLFYRTAEIHARAERVNETLRPDLVLCLHFNAEGWGDPQEPTLVNRTHLHLLLNGAYTPDELALEDQRFAMIRKVLQRTYFEEKQVGATVASIFAQKTQLPPYRYSLERGNVRAIPGQTYLWARNLLANRLYDCPVIFMEPYVMNSIQDHARIQAGDYLGEREIAGIMKPSIFREYADALAEGLAQHYRRERGVAE